MTVEGVISTVSGERYRINISGHISAEIPALHSSYRLKIDFEQKTWEECPPAVGDRVLCFFPGGCYVDGYILGLLEG